MSIVKLLVHGRPYEIACGDGEEVHLRALGEELSVRVGELAGKLRQGGHKQVSQDYLMMMVSLTLLDELHEWRIDAESGMAPEEPNASASGGQRRAEVEAAMAETLDKIAARIESIAGSV